MTNKQLIQYIQKDIKRLDEERREMPKITKGATAPQILIYNVSRRATLKEILGKLQPKKQPSKSSQ